MGFYVSRSILSAGIVIGALQARELRADTTCDLAALSSSTCAGPFEFQTYVEPCWAEKRTAACGPPIGYEKKVVPVYPSCRLEAHGLESRANASHEFVLDGSFKSEQVCDPDHKPPCHTVRVCHLENASCEDGGRHIYESNVPPAYRGDSSYHARELSEDITKRCSRDCRVDITNEPTFKLQADPNCGPQQGTTQVDDLSKPIYNACRNPAHGEAPLGECGVVPAPKYSSFALSSQALASQQPKLVPGPKCTTCDTLGGDPAALQRCLKEQAGRVSTLPVDRPRLDTILVEKQKLLYELFADKLAASGRSELQALYVSRPDPLPNCRSKTPLPSVPAGCQARATYSRALFCQRLLLDHVSVAVAATGFDACLALGSEIKSLPAVCAPDTLAASYIANLTELTQHLVGSIDREGTPALPSVTSLRNALAMIERWQQAVRPFGDAAASRHTQMMDAIQQIVATLWSSARNAGELPVGATRDQIAAQALEVDRRILLAAIGDAPTISGAALGHVLVRGFGGISDRVRSVSMFSDLGCLLQKCGSGGASSELSELWALWAQLGNPDGTKTALAGTTHVRAPWRVVFEGLAKNGAAVQNAIAASTRSGKVADLATADPTGLFEIALPLSSLVRESVARSTSFTRTGRLDLQARAVLRGGLASAQISAIENELNGRMSSLRVALDEFKANERQYLSDLLGDLANRVESNAAKQQLVDRENDLLNLSSDLAGLRESAAFEAAQFADFTTSFVDAAKTQSSKLVETVETKVSIDARNARQSTPSTRVSDVAAQPGGSTWKHRIPKGSLAVIHTTGEWSPTCALRKSRVFDPSGSGNSAPIDVTTAQVGPEGYLLQWQGSSYATKANRTSSSVADHRSTSASGKACAGAKASVTTPKVVTLWSPLDIEVYASVEGCISADTGRTITDSTDAESADGNESRRSMAFSSGLRVEGTPFPGFPAGALLAIRTAAGSDDLTTSAVYVVRGPVTEITVDVDSDLYFAVNDAQCADSSGSISVTIDESQLVGAMAESVGATMSTVLSGLRDSATRILHQGRILPNELAVLREDALQVLRQKVNNADALPPVLRGMFETWLDVELLKIQRQVEIVTIERSMALIKSDVESNHAALALNDGKQRLIEEMTRASIDNIDSARLTPDVERVGDLLSGYIYPALELRYPSVLDEMLRDRKIADKFTGLVSLDFMQPVSALGRAALDIADEFKQKWDAQKLADVGNANVGTGAVVSFPRPGAAITSQWAKADPTRSARVWNAILDPAQARVTLEIRAEDLYGAHGGASKLQCTEASPIIRSMGVYVGIDSQGVGDSRNGQGWRAPAEVDGALLFTTALGPKNYLLANGDWLSQQMPFLFGVSSNAASIFESLGRKFLVGNGLSPFTKYELDLTELRSGLTSTLTDATEIILAFEIERQPIASPGVRGIAACVSTPADHHKPFSPSSRVVKRAPMRVLPGVKQRSRSW